MAVQINRAARQTAAIAPASNQQEEREPTLLWLNVGFMSQNPTTGEEEFVSLPMGIPLDTMKTKPVTGKNEDWRRLMTAKNQLLEQLQNFADGLAPGEEEIISDLQVQVRRVAEHNDDAVDENPHVTHLRSLSFVRRSA